MKKETEEKEEVISEKEIKEAEAETIKKKEKPRFDETGWKPKTDIGKKVKNKEIKDIDFILDNSIKILEPEIVDILIADGENELLLIGQSKGKFGGGARRVFKQTQKKTCEGNRPKFSTYAVFGNKNGIVGVGFGKSKETVPTREKAIRKAKLNVFKIRRGCGSWECNCKDPHSIPFKVHGKCGSSEIILMPAPKGTGLCLEKECAKILKLAGIKDVWSKTKGQTKTKVNLINACLKALHDLMSTKVQHQYNEVLNICEGEEKQEEQKND